MRIRRRGQAHLPRRRGRGAIRRAGRSARRPRRSGHVTVHGGLLLPVPRPRPGELLGEELTDGSLVPPRRRPLPNSPVFALDADETAEVLRSGGELRSAWPVGTTTSTVTRAGRQQGGVPAAHGILGTTGGGKSTTVAGLVDSCAGRSGRACCSTRRASTRAITSRPTTPACMRALARRGLEPARRPATHASTTWSAGRRRTPTTPTHAAFSLRFAELSPYAVHGDPGPERRPAGAVPEGLRHHQAACWSSCGSTRRTTERARAAGAGRDRDRLPGDDAAHLYDMVGSLRLDRQRDVAKDDLTLPTVPARPSCSRSTRDKVAQVIAPANAAARRSELVGAPGPARRVKRLGIFDNRQLGPL